MAPTCGDSLIAPKNFKFANVNMPCKQFLAGLYRHKGFSKVLAKYLGFNIKLIKLFLTSIWFSYEKVTGHVLLRHFEITVNICLVVRSSIILSRKWDVQGIKRDLTLPSPTFAFAFIPQWLDYS